MGSTSELEYHLLLSHDLDLLEEQAYQDLASQITEIKRMLAGFVKTLKS